MNSMLTSYISMKYGSRRTLAKLETWTSNGGIYVIEIKKTQKLLRLSVRGCFEVMELAIQNDNHICVYCPDLNILSTLGQGRHG